MPASFLLAPMAEISHRALRELIESFKPPEVRPIPNGQIPGAGMAITGADEYFTEMISAGALVAGGPFEAWYADNGPCPEKLVYQVVGGDPDMLQKAVVFLDQKECLGIDINMGCSAPAITRSGAGVRWMADMDRAATLIHRLRPLTRRRLSVKLRIGLGDDFEYLVAFCRRLEEEGIDFITLHPRTAREKFKRRARWGYVSALKKELHIPLAGNGDIASAEDMLLHSGECDAVMIGRLAIRRPWVFAEAKMALETMHESSFQKTITQRRKGAEEIAQFSCIDLEEIGCRFLELLSRYQPPEFHISRARLFFSYFCDNLKWGNYVKNLLNRETDLGGVERAWRGFFAERREENSSLP